MADEILDLDAIGKRASSLIEWTMRMPSSWKRSVRDVPLLIAEVRRLRCVIAQHELCHDLHGKVDAEAFANSCAAEQRRIYGKAPTADALDESRKREAAMREFARELLGFLKRIGWTREFAQDLVDGKECFAVDDDLGRELLRILAGTPEGGKVTP